MNHNKLLFNTAYDEVHTHRVMRTVGDARCSVDRANRRMKPDSERLVAVDGIVAGIPIRKCDVTQGSYFTGWAILGDSNQS